MPFVYGFKNDSMPDLIKIGHHGGDTPLTRLNEANLPDTFRPPTPYYLAFAIEVQESFKAEAYIHNLLINERVNVNREFFRISLEDVKNIINNHMNIIKGEWWIPPPPLIITETKKTHKIGAKCYKNRCIKQLNELIICCETLYKELDKLQLLTDDGINCQKIFTRDDIEILGYKHLQVEEINKYICMCHLIHKKNIGTDGKINNYKSIKSLNILDRLLEYIGYKVNVMVRRFKMKGKSFYEYKYNITTKPYQDLRKGNNGCNRFIFNNKINK
jgi:hypothetical protein